MDKFDYSQNGIIQKNILVTRRIRIERSDVVNYAPQIIIEYQKNVVKYTTLRHFNCSIYF